MRICRVFQSNNAKDAEGFCGGQGYKLFKFQNFQPNTKLDWKEEMERFMECKILWLSIKILNNKNLFFGSGFYPALSMGKNGKVLVNLDGDETGALLAKFDWVGIMRFFLFQGGFLQG